MFDGSQLKQRVQGWRTEISPYGIAVAVVFAAFALLCFREIANWWQFGHNGFNGSTYMRAALNSLRFDLWGQVKYHQGYEAPPTDTYFIHHPLMLHVHLVPLAALFGREPWVGRLVPALYSFANLGMLFIVVRHYYGRTEALASSIIFILLPINVVYANMIDHVSGAIFWCLFFLFVYMRWREELSGKYFWLSMFAITMAVQWEWVGYYLALFVVLHAFACGLRRERPFRWNPEYTFVVVFSIVVLANAAAFFGYAYLVKGGLQELVHTFEKRTSSPSNYWSTIWNYSKDHYGVLPFGLFGLWGLQFLFRWVRGEQKLRDLLPLGFFFIQVVHSTLFKESGQIHSYWIYYIGVAFAAGGGEVVGKVADALERPAAWLAEQWEHLRDGSGRSTERVVPALRTVLLVAVVAVPLGAQAKVAWKKISHGVAKGGIPNYGNYDPMIDEAMALEAIQERYPRGTVKFLLHKPLSFRSELKYYLDAPIGHRRSLRGPDPPIESDRKRVFLIDIRHVDEREQLNRLVQNYRTMLFDRQFLAVELTDPDGPFEAFVRVERKPSLVWSWFVNGRVPPGSWEPDPRIQRPEQFFPVPIETNDGFETGGKGGNPFVWNCPSGEFLDGFEFVDDNFGNILSGIRPLCAPPDGADAAGGFTERIAGPVWGDEFGANTRRVVCGEGGSVVGIHGRSGGMVDALGIICGPVDGKRPADRSSVKPEPPDDKKGDEGKSDGGTSKDDRAEKGDETSGASDGGPTEETDAEEGGSEETDGTSRDGAKPQAEELKLPAQYERIGPVGGPGGDPFWFVCPKGSAAWLLRGRSGKAIDRVGIGCAQKN